MPKTRGNRDLQHGSRRSQRQGYHLTCSNCRNRKVKCDGARPQCGICLAYGESCLYDKIPPMSQIQAMADRITELETALRRHTASPSSNAVSDDGAQAEFTGPQPESTTVNVNSPTTLAESPWYTSTSAVHEPVHAADSQILEPPQAPLVPRPVSMTTSQLVYWEENAISTCATLLHLSGDKLRHLLKTHLCWVQPAFMFITPSLFMRDAASGGPNFSQFLLTVVCLHSTRFTDHYLRDDLLARARLMLGQEIHKPYTATTVQALLQMSAHEVGRGSISQAWLYSGMAFRIAIDLGIFSDMNRSTEKFEEKQTRQRLAWSCFLWDKAMSLYLGRIPTLRDAPMFGLPPIDESVDSSLWRPYCSSDAFKTWPSTASHASTCFQNFCKLAIIVNDVLLTIYDKHRSKAISASFVQETRDRLEKWRNDSPDSLKICAGDQICPPPHILTQNLLFQTTLILLHRPFHLNGSCRKICRDAANEVEHHLILLEKAFKFSHVTYLMAYCAYTAATVALQDMKDGISGSQAKVNTYLRALYGVRSSCPGIQCSIDIIVRNFDSSPVTLNTVNTSITSQHVPMMDFDLLPAFPLQDVDAFADAGNGQLDTLPFGSLDFFAHEWSAIPDDQLNNFLL